MCLKCCAINFHSKLFYSQLNRAEQDYHLTGDTPQKAIMYIPEKYHIHRNKAADQDEKHNVQKTGSKFNQLDGRGCSVPVALATSSRVGSSNGSSSAGRSSETGGGGATKHKNDAV